ncbi:MAG: efflux RND transporter periplasmic adaptor subunit [Pseudomonadota bacterium]
MTNSATSREKRPSAAKGLIFIIVLLVATSLLVLGALTQRAGGGPIIPTETPQPLSVSVDTVVLSDALDLEEEFSGIVQAKRSSRLGFPAGGRIAQINVDVGDRVKKGQRLATLDTRDLRAQLTAAEASTTEAQADFNLAQVTVSRQQTLFERGHVAKQRVDEALAAANAAAARIEAADARADTLRVAIDLAAIRAPFDGTVTARMADEGAIAAPSAPLLDVVETGALEARIGLPAAVAKSLERDRLYELSTSDGIVTARLRADTGVIDQGRRTVTTVFDIENMGEAAIGSVVRLPLTRGIAERGFWVPVSALTESRRGLWSIYIVERQSSGWRARPRLVEIVHSDADRVFARGTVRDGEQFITDGLQRLVPDQPVTPIAAATSARTKQEG